MSNQIETAYINQFHDNITLLVQQKDSRLSPWVRKEMQKGEYAFHNRVGSVTPALAAGRGASTVLSNTPHDRRRTVLKDYEFADIVDPKDLYRIATDPTAAYTKAIIAGFNRKKDDVIIDAFFADVATGKAGATTTVFPVASNAAYNVDVGNTNGMTISKAINAKTNLLSLDNDPDDAMYIAINAKALEDLLADEKVINKDYGFESLRDGMVRDILGYKWIFTNRLTTASDGTNTRRQIPVWVDGGMLMSIGEDVVTSYDKRPDISLAMQLYTRMGVGATRMEEDKVNRIYFTE